MQLTDHSCAGLIGPRGALPASAVASAQHRCTIQHRRPSIQQMKITYTQQCCPCFILLPGVRLTLYVVPPATVSPREIARRLGCTPARITHLLDLTLLAPAIQEHLLALEAIDGREPTTERALRRLTRAASWQDQWAAWCKLGLAALPAPRTRSQQTLVT